ncbi:MAG: PAS domain S-box protein, partial [Thermomicrobiaceae bacterium]|nr:PAS domain S-box protein [Thermomicrobiaceae bacterium]
ERECPIYRAFRDGQPCRVDDDVFWRRGGTPLPVEYSAAPIVDQGRITGTVVAFNDITARRAAEEAAERSRAQVANILESITDAFFALDHDFRFTYVNHQAGPLLQRDPADLLGKCVWDEFPEAVGTQFFEQYRRVATERVSASFEEYYPPLGKWFEVHAYPARDGISVYFRDVTERKRAEQRLAAQHAVTRALADADTIQRAAPEILRTVAQTLEWDCGLLWLVDRQEGVLHCVDLWVAPGIDAQEFVALSRQRRLPPGVGLPGTVWATQAPYWVVDNEREPNFVRMAAARRAGLRSAFAVPVRTADEVVGALEFHSRARREEDPELLTVMAALGSQIGQFIERTRAEAALRESEARKDAILRSALDAIVSMDATGRIVEFNPAAEQMFGYSREEAIGAPLADLIIPPALRERHWQGLERYLATGVGPILNQRVEVTAMRRDGTEFPVELAITSVRVGDRETFTGYIRDITERRRVEEERSELLDRERAARAEAEEAAAVVHRLQLI